MFSNLRLVVPLAIFEMQELCLHRNYRSCKIQEDQVALKTCQQLLRILWTRQQKNEGPFVYLDCFTSLMRRILKIDRLEFKLILEEKFWWTGGGSLEEWGLKDNNTEDGEQIKNKETEVLSNTIKAGGARERGRWLLGNVLRAAYHALAVLSGHLSKHQHGGVVDLVLNLPHHRTSGISGFSGGTPALWLPAGFQIAWG